MMQRLRRFESPINMFLSDNAKSDTPVDANCKLFLKKAEDKSFKCSEDRKQSKILKNITIICDFSNLTSFIFKI